MSKDWSMPKGFTKEEAEFEAKRCLSCKNPSCEKGCPAGVKIRDFIYEIKKNNLETAYDIIRMSSNLPHICSIVCPHERQCVGHCVLGIKGKPIDCGKLERYVTEQISKPIIKQNISCKRVAIIGAGPAGISCAIELASAGCRVDIYEETKAFGGVMAYGIPNYRLDKSYVAKSLNEILALGVQIHYHCSFMEEDILALKDKYDAVFISIGLTESKRLGVPNENISGVYDALDFLRQVNSSTKFNEGNLPRLKGKTIVVGAGNVAMDVARSAIRLGSEVTIVYRRSRQEAPATNKEISDALNEGVEFKFLNAPIEVIGKDHVQGLRVEVMELGEMDSSGRRKPVGTKEFIDIPCDNIICAIGQNPRDIYNVGELKTDYKYLVCEDLKTNISNIYAGGDIVLGAKTIVEAMVCGKKVANMILENN